MSSTTPTDSISCPHGALLPAALGPRARRTAVPLPLWEYFKHNWRRAEKQHQQLQAEEAALSANAVHCAQ